MEDLKDKLERAIELYRMELGKADRREDFNPGPWLVAEGVPRIIFVAWIGSVFGVWRLAYVNEGGRVLLYGDPLPPHARTAGWLLREFTREIERHLGARAVMALDFSTDEDYEIGGYGVKVPDMSIAPQRGPTPCIVAEVGYHNERNFDAVKAEVDLWVSFGVPIVIGIKITDYGRASVEDPSIEVIAKAQGFEDQVFSLSFNCPSPCLGEGTHMIAVPSRLLVSRTLLPGLAPDNIHIDLFDLQSRIRVWVRNRASRS